MKFGSTARASTVVGMNICQYGDLAAGKFAFPERHWV